MNSVNGTVLIIDDDLDIQEILKDRLESLGYEALTGSNGREGLEILESNTSQMVFVDIEMPDMNGLDVLREIRRRGSDVPVVMITAFGTVERAVQAMKEGAYDFIPKPFEADHIALVVKRALEREELKREVEIYTDETNRRYQLVGCNSPIMNETIETAKRAASSSATVLLLGESGTGKEVLAHAIHGWSERRSQPFIAISCVGLSKELLESELFGHEKGAFTGAHQLKKGKIELANQGTVFLDEVGDVSEEVQTKLLRFLQERTFERVGGTHTVTLDVRIIAATNRELEKAVAEGRFREDLYHRINVVPIKLPPLRERKEDIPLLAGYFLQHFSSAAKRGYSGLTQEALEKLHDYSWPGNVRELGNVIERAIVLGKDSQITLQDLPPRIVAAEPEMQIDTISYHRAMDAYKRQLIMKALDLAQGSRTAAAKILGLQRTYLSRLIRNLKID